MKQTIGKGKRGKRPERKAKKSVYRYNFSFSWKKKTEKYK